MRAGWYTGLCVALWLAHSGCGRLGITFGGKAPGEAGSIAVGRGEFADLPAIGGLTGKHVLFVRDERVLIMATESGEETDVTGELDALYPGTDQWAGASRSGEWLTLSSDRLNCDGDACLTLVRRDMSYVRRVMVDGEPIRIEGRAAVNSNADIIVFPGAIEGAPHDLDLFAVFRTGEEWGTPVLLTGSFSSPYNTQPVFDASGRRVLFDCGTTPSSQEDTSICEVDVNGSGSVTIDVTANPLGTAGPHALHHADYAGGNTLVFESTWGGSEHIWRRTDGILQPVSLEFANDNTPCAFSDGQIASLWLDRPGGTGVHELKLMDTSGGGLDVLTPDQDLADVGLSCIGL